MAAPTPTVRQSPTGRKLWDGYQVKVTFALDPDVSLWEKTITPPGIDGGDAIDQTTQHNDDWRTSAPRGLVTLTESTFTAAYDPAAYSQLLALVNKLTTVTELFCDGSTIAYYGFLRTFQPDAMSEGTQPEATVTITPTNFDHVNGVEAGPTITSIAGT